MQILFWSLFTFLSPVPPAIMPTFLAVLITAGDFLSGWIANSPAEGKLEHLSRGTISSVWPLIHHTDLLTSAFVGEQTAGSSEVNGVVDFEAFQVLTHLPALWEFRVDAFKVNLSSVQRDSVNNKTRFLHTNQHSSAFHLHHQVHEAFVIIAGHWRVRTDNQLPVNFGRQINVLPWKR